MAMSCILPCCRTQSMALKPLLVVVYIFDIAIGGDQAVDEPDQKGCADQYYKIGRKKG